MKIGLAWSVGFLALGALTQWTFPAQAGDLPHFKKVMIVVLENADYDEALRQPFLKQLSQEGAAFTQFYAETHPSQPNYIAMISGSTQGVFSDGNVDLDAQHVGDLLEAAGKSWKVYAEDFPGACFLGDAAGEYARKHVPFISFTNVSRNPARCAKIVNASQLDLDIARGELPDFSLYVPGLKNDGHDTSAGYADHWLSQYFGPRLSDPKFAKDMLFIVTFDEADNLFGPNQIYTAFYGDSVIPGAKVAAKVDHYGVLKTIENVLGLGSLNQKDRDASAIRGIWKP